jgi:hypothetical protein
MRYLACILGVASMTLPALAQTSAPEPAPLPHLIASFNLSVHASYAVVAPLFGPEGERPGPASTGIRSLFIHNPPPTSRAPFSQFNMGP